MIANRYDGIDLPDTSCRLLIFDSEPYSYLQEMARYTLSFDVTESNNLQRRAHLKNHALLRPSSGMQIERIVVISQKCMERTIAWIKKHETYEELRLAVDDILDRLTFGIKADRFEDAFNQLGTFLGFVAQRPENEWKEGPDNLWGLREDEYLLVECKIQELMDAHKLSVGAICSEYTESVLVGRRR